MRNSALDIYFLVLGIETQLLHLRSYQHMMQQIDDAINDEIH